MSEFPINYESHQELCVVLVHVHAHVEFWSLPPDIDFSNTYLTVKNRQNWRRWQPGRDCDYKIKCCTFLFNSSRNVHVDICKKNHWLCYSQYEKCLIVSNLLG